MDNPKNKSPQDRSQVSITEEWEVTWWTEQLGVSTKQLSEAVKKVGNSANRVKVYLEGIKTQ
jgi:hypothetical protein